MVHFLFLPSLLYSIQKYCYSFLKNIINYFILKVTWGSGIFSLNSGSLNIEKIANSFLLPSVINLPNSGLWSVKKQNGLKQLFKNYVIYLEVAHSWPCQIKGVCGQSNNRVLT